MLTVYPATMGRLLLPPLEYALPILDAIFSPAQAAVQISPLKLSRWHHFASADQSTSVWRKHYFQGSTEPECQRRHVVD
jgi:hypothetical protein